MYGDMFIKEFIQYIRYEKNYSTHTVVAYIKDIDEFFAYISEYDVSSPSSVTFDMIRSWMISLIEKGESAGTVNRKISSLRSYWRFLMRRGYVSSNPLKQVVLPKRSKRLPVFLKEEEMEKVLNGDFEDSFEGCRDHLIISMFYQTGMRLSEMLGLNDADVNTDECLLKVTGKRNKQRIIPFGQDLRVDILNYYKIRKKETDRRCDSFLVRKDGNPLYPQLVYRIVNKHLKRSATLSKNSPHVLRHTFATTMLNRGAELNAVKQLLGHSTLAATEIYTHTTFEELKKIYKQAHPRA